MASVPPPSGGPPEPGRHDEPKTLWGAIIALLTGFSTLSTDQSNRMIAGVLTAAILAIVGWLIYWDRKDRYEHTAMIIRSYEAQMEQGRASREQNEKQTRDFYASEREKERQHCAETDMRRDRFMADQREKDRHFYSELRNKDQNAIHAMVNELLQWRAAFTEFLKKQKLLNKGDGD